MANYNTVITNEGAALLASVIANHGTITFTNLKLSENDYTGQEATLTEGTFDGIFANVSVASSIVDITTIKVSATVHGYNFSGDHNLYALGVIGTDGNTTALIAICTTTNPDVLRDNASTYAFNINLTVSSTSDITVVGTTAAVLYDIDVVDNLTSPATDKPLSANMGKKLSDEKQDKTLATPITVDGTQETTVEGALGALNTYSDKIKDNLSNRNLVDNGWFTVNQRGFTSGTTSAYLDKYCVDRWKISYRSSGSDGTVTLTSSGLQIVASANGSAVLTHTSENSLAIGTPFTLSVLFSNGTIESYSDNMASSLAKVFDDVILRAEPNIVQVDVRQSKTVTIRAVKLEVGSVSTLHLDIAPDYTTELLKCQRYFKRIQAKENAAHLTIGAAITATTVYAIIPLPVPLRTTPTFSYSGSLVFLTGGNAISVSSVSLYEKTESSVTLVMSLASSVTAGVCGSVNLSTAGDYIDLASDL